MTLEHDVGRHYARSGLAEAIRQALLDSGKDPDHLTPQDLGPVDQFHIGGAQATAELFARVAPAPGSHWLDVGSGLGGPARHLALAHGCRVTGIDLTQDYVDVANDLAQRVGLADRVTFHQGSALALPFAEGGFDGASLMHVGMNIADKPALFAGIRRVLRPGGLFVIFDVMRMGAGDLAYPVPWAATLATSFVTSPGDYLAALRGAGFDVVMQRDRSAFALDFFRAMQARMAAQGPPPLGLNLVMGADAPVKTANMLRNIQAGLIAPVEMVARA